MSSVTCCNGIDHTESCNHLDVLSLQTTKSFDCNWTVINVHLLPFVIRIFQSYSLLTNCTKQCVFNTMGIYNL